MGTGLQQTRDEIGTEDTTNFIFKRFSEKFNVRQGPVVVETRDVTNDSIWGNGDAWGSDLWQADYINEQEIVEVINQGNFFVDNYDLTLFNDDSTTTADITTDGEINFTSGEIYQSKIVAKDGTTYLNATLNVTIDSGSFDLYMWTDNNTPELIANNTQHTFTNPGTSIKYKIVENNTSTGKITNTQVQY